MLGWKVLERPCLEAVYGVSLLSIFVDLFLDKQYNKSINDITKIDIRKDAILWTDMNS